MRNEPCFRFVVRPIGSGEVTTIPSFRAAGHPAWIVCRRLDQYSVRDNATLRMLAGLGRVRPDDFLVNTRDGSCLRAREIPELKAVFRSRTVRRIGKVSPLLARVVSAFWPV